MDQYEIIGEICAEALLSRKDCEYLMRIIQQHFRYFSGQVLPASPHRRLLMLKNFGSFRFYYHPPRVLTPPNQSGPITAQAHYVLRFTPSLLMAAIANGEIPPP